jgi:hypothetical protein
MSFIHPSNFSFLDDKCSEAFNEIDFNLIENESQFYTLEAFKTNSLCVEGIYFNLCWMNEIKSKIIL